MADPWASCWWSQETSHQPRAAWSSQIKWTSECSDLGCSLVWWSWPYSDKSKPLSCQLFHNFSFVKYDVLYSGSTYLGDNQVIASRGWFPEVFGYLRIGGSLSCLISSWFQYLEPCWVLMRLALSISHVVHPIIEFLFLDHYLQYSLFHRSSPEHPWSKSSYSTHSKYWKSEQVDQWQWQSSHSVYSNQSHKKAWSSAHLWNRVFSFGSFCFFPVGPMAEQAALVQLVSIGTSWVIRDFHKP